MGPFRFFLLTLAWLLAGPALITEAAPPCNPEAAARFGVVSNTCFFDEPMDAVDEAECADFGANLWLEPFQPLRPERWTGTSMFLYRRNDTIGWVAVGPRCSVRKAVRAHLNEVVELLISSGQLHDVVGEKGPSIASSEDAIWWISELLRAYFAELVHETGRPLGRAFFGEEGKLACGTNRKDSGALGGGFQAVPRPGRPVRGARPRAIRVKEGWRVTLEEWRCEDRAYYQWVFVLPDKGYLEDESQLKVYKVGTAPGCDCE